MSDWTPAQWLAYFVQQDDRLMAAAIGAVLAAFPSARLIAMERLST